MTKKKICIVTSTYNEEITSQICEISKNELSKLNYNNVMIIKVPGAFEIPVAISRLINKFDGFIAIGCVIKGETNNFDLISQAITNAIMQISISAKKPIGNAILTCFKKDQAAQRLNKGLEAVKALDIILKNV
tara:strand:+ start:263 stop:661 length:399 start_codon:yes stop_codon:yes gene_type:complete